MIVQREPVYIYVRYIDGFYDAWGDANLLVYALPECTHCLGVHHAYQTP